MFAGQREMKTMTFILMLGAGMLGPSSIVPQTIDVVLVERPDALIILNRFEQTLSPRERTWFFKNVPLRIVRQDVLLSDRFTHAMEVELGRTRFLLQRRSSGDVTGAAAAGLQKVVGLRRTSDTVDVLQRGKIAFRQDGAVALDAGERIERFFEYRGRYFCRHIASGAYGWVELPSSDRGITWEIVSPIRNHGNDVAGQLQSIVDDVNAASTTIARVTGDTMPLWELIRVIGGWNVLREPPAKRWVRTDEALFNKIRSRLIGHSVTRRNNEIVVRSR
jgi:hypothetical protein